MDENSEDKPTAYKPFLTESDTQKRKISQYELKELLYKAEPYKAALDVTITKEYTHPSAWAHTIPEFKNICIRPPEFIDYNLGFNRVLGHEIGHNKLHAYGLPDGDEDRHTIEAYQNLNMGMFDLKSKSTYVY
jgi:hypothetical protein